MYTSTHQRWWCRQRSSLLLRCLPYLLACFCVLTVLSMLSYILEIRSHYRPLEKDFYALSQEAKKWWGSSALKLLLTAEALPELRFRGVTAHPALYAEEWNQSSTRLGVYGSSQRAEVVEKYGLEAMECLWSTPPSTVTSTSSPSDTEDSSLSLHIFFLHGNAGSHTQGEYWNCAAHYVSRLLGRTATHTYAFQLAEEANVHRGRLMGQQANYVADVVEHVLRRAQHSSSSRYTANKQPEEQHERRDDGPFFPSSPSRPPRHAVWFVAHSMGGVVARAAAQLLDASIPVGGIVTFNSPLRFPPLLLDAPMSDLYRALAWVEQVPLQNDAPVADRSDGWTFPRKVSTEELVRVCASRGSSCDVYRQRRLRHSRRPKLISITSGEMDLQIEPATTFPHTWQSSYDVSFMNTLNRSLCGHAASHDAVLVDPCAVTLAAVNLFAAALERSGSRDGTSREKTSEVVENPETVAQLPLASGVLQSSFSLLGQFVWQQHLWPFAVAALYAYTLLCLVWETHVVGMVHVVQRQRCWTWLARRCTANSASTSTSRWNPPHAFSGLFFLTFFYGCVGVYTTVIGLYLSLSAGGRQAPQQWFAETYPWQWACFPQLRHISRSAIAAPFVFAWYTLVFVFASLGPVTLGTSAGVGMVALARGVRRLKRIAGTCCQSRAKNSSRRRRVAMVLRIALLFCAYGVLLLVANLTARAAVWLLLSLLVPGCLAAPQPKRDEVADVGGGTGVGLKQEVDEEEVDRVEVTFPADAAALKAPLTAALAERSAPQALDLSCMLYAALYLIQLQPFFTIRNTVISHTSDHADTVDAVNYVAELGLLVLLGCSLCCCSATAAAIATSLLLPRTLPFVRELRAVLGAVAVLAVAWLLLHPVESFRVLPTLLWCFPCFLSSTLSM